MLLILFMHLFAQPNAVAGGCESYCVGIRGNGEAVPAHWAALSRMVEESGMPEAAAGGSSATVTMFLLDSMSGNSVVASEPDLLKKRKMQALMLKSMPEFSAVLAQDAKIADGYAMMKAYSGGDPALVKKAKDAFTNAGALSPAELKAAFAKYGSLLNPELLAMVGKNPARFGPEAAKSITNLGKFNAVTDDTLFVRPGLVDFKGMAVVLGYMADFYAGNTDADTKEKFNAYLADCGEKTFRQEWNADAACKERFQKIAGDYIRAGKFQNKALFEKVGTHFSALPSTSVVQGEGVAKYLKLKQDYLNGHGEKVAGFSFNFEKEMGFGYWGQEKTLGQADQGLEKYREDGDLKAKKFVSLGAANWFEVLATSPAEPGIANLQKIPSSTTREQVLAELEKPFFQRWKGLHYRSDVLSAGGWSDLHPTTVLKAGGCKTTVYLTRHADYGDSKFGQQVFIRLTGTQKQIPFWGKIEEGGASGWCVDKIRAAGGDPAEVAKTPWAQISNLCNPQSSFRRALDVADGSMCTDWDSPQNEVFQGKMWALVKDAYESPLIPNGNAGQACKLNNPPANPDPRVFAGCLPFAQRSPGPRPIPADSQNSGVSPAE